MTVYFNKILTKLYIKLGILAHLVIYLSKII